ncbi:uncharacterized protein [Parasteatoda tepidariorum]|uniref:uncharacterized protein n=1 Tax=Parasteatoda tepidariorum TaxID=114398 RepID=UPI00077FA3D5|nr:uncharacterized protein LOC107454968 [Parasteatoda tepidariorum]XP_015927827.1 uncharacterized protein LOC107454968 [Parasteatoda tepidariorum]XP_042896887.1 uncharacterized protein LOC107454968 [Parasteatoda tepidariorum]XP_042896888.1 uncharacterized protein LOC107454968 [Parasteatoda tepidariorum]XP_042896889.1 uncharacterized protein LOC107454968 [Parasteatoda tepidariorum]
MTAEIKKKVTSGIKQKIKEAGWSVVKTAALSAAVTAGVSSAFPAIGFTNGIVAGSIVSIYQRNYNNGKIIPSPFSLMKIVGVKGLIVVTKVGITAATVATTGIYGACKTIWNKSKRRDNTEEKSNELKENTDSCNEEEENEEINEIIQTLQMENTSIDTEWVNIQPAEDETLVTVS